MSEQSRDSRTIYRACWVRILPYYASSPRISGTVQFIEKSAVYNRQNYQWSEYRGIPYAEAERFEYSSQGFSDCQFVQGWINTDIVRSARIKDSFQFPNGEMKNHL